MKYNRPQDLTTGFDRGLDATIEMLEAYHDPIKPDVLMGMVYGLFCAGYGRSRKNLKYMDRLVEKTLEAAKQDSKEIMDKEEEASHEGR